MHAVPDTPPRRRPISAVEYHRMAEAGILAHGERVELIEGEIIEMAPIGDAHQAIVDQLNRILVRAVGDRGIVRVQGSTRLSDFSEPQPDLLVLAPREDFYRSRSTTGADVLLLIEVADSSLRYDREVKMPLYARYGVVESWLVDVRGSAITAYRQPSAEGYLEVAALELAAPIAAMSLPGVALDLSTLLL